MRRRRIDCVKAKARWKCCSLRNMGKIICLFASYCGILLPSSFVLVNASAFASYFLLTGLSLLPNSFCSPTLYLKQPINDIASSLIQSVRPAIHPPYSHVEALVWIDLQIDAHIPKNTLKCYNHKKLQYYEDLVSFFSSSDNVHNRFLKEN